MSRGPSPHYLLKLPLLDPQARRELGIVASYLLDEPLGGFASDDYGGTRAPQLEHE